MSTKEKFNQSLKDLHLSLLSEGRPIYLNAWGLSMYPFIKNGDRIKIEPAQEKEIKVGDLVAVNMSDGKFFVFVHRVVKIENENGARIYFTKGDFHRRGLDKPVTAELIKGKITQIQRNGLNINLEWPLWRCFNRITAKLSLSHPAVLSALSRPANLIIERRSFLSKLNNRFRKGTPVVYNTEELLLICAGKSFGTELNKQLTELTRQGLDWQRFTESATKGGIAVLAYEKLRSAAGDIYLPQFVLDRLKSRYLFLVAKSVSRHKELLALLQVFAQEDIAVIPLKGTTLASRLYGDFAARGLSADFDLLVKQEDKEKAEALLRQLGYSVHTEGEIRQWSWQHSFYRPKATIVDLHWDISMMGRMQERINGLWAGAREVLDDGASYYDFAAEELLLYLSVHLVNSSRFSQLKYFRDINILLYKYRDRLDWSGIIGKARSWGLSNSLYLALKSSQELFGVGLPSWVLNSLRPNLLKVLLIKTFVNRRVILRNGIRRRLMDHFLSYIFFELLEAKGVGGYSRIIKRVLFPPPGVLLISGYAGARSHFWGYAFRLVKGSLVTVKRCILPGCLK